MSQRIHPFVKTLSLRTPLRPGERLKTFRPAITVRRQDSPGRPGAAAAPETPDGPRGPSTHARRAPVWIRGHQECPGATEPPSRTKRGWDQPRAHGPGRWRPARTAGPGCQPALLAQVVSLLCCPRAAVEKVSVKSQGFVESPYNGSEAFVSAVADRLRSRGPRSAPLWSIPSPIGPAGRREWGGSRNRRNGPPGS